MDCKEIKPVHPKGDPSWIFIGRTDAEAEAPILWLPNGKNGLIWKDPDAGKDINNLRYTDDTTLMVESEQKLKRVLMKVTEESEKASLKINIQIAAIMASGPITSW